jgi:EpsI family protein
MPAGNIRFRILTALVGVTALAATRITSIQAEGRANVRDPAPLAMAFGAWKGTGIPVPADVQKALPSARLLCRRYRSPMGEADVTIISGSDATALHDPHDCLAGEGWQFLSDVTRQVAPEGGPPFTVRDVVMDKSGVRARMWYWYQVDEAVFANTVSARLALFRKRLGGSGKPRAEFVRLIVGGETESARTELMLADLTKAVASR